MLKVSGGKRSMIPLYSRLGNSQALSNCCKLYNSYLTFQSLSRGLVTAITLHITSFLPQKSSARDRLHTAVEESEQPDLHKKGCSLRS
jgi:hypothetical protein